MSDTNIASKSQKIKQYFRLDYLFGDTDTRWLSVFRILFCFVLLKDAIYHLFLAELFYSDTGVVPRFALFDGLVRDARFSLMDAIGQPWLAFIFFCVWIVVLLCLIVGYRTRLMAILNFIIILSVHERNGYILTSADTLMRVISFWLMFAPIGQYYAVDVVRERWRKFRNTSDVNALRVTSEPRTAFALPMRLLQLQFVIIYIVTGYLKAQGQIWQEGNALHYVAQIETFATPLGLQLQYLPDVMLTGLTYFSLYAEIAIPILLLLPIFWRFSRLLAFVLALMLHGGIALTLSIADFSILMLICYLPFFDPEWLKRLEIWFIQKVSTITVSLPDDVYHPTWLWLSLTSNNQLTVQASDTDKPSHQEIAQQLAFSRLWGWVFYLPLIPRFIDFLASYTVKRLRDKPLSKPRSNFFTVRYKVILSAVLIPLFVLVIMWNIEEATAYTDHDVTYPDVIDSILEETRDIIWYTGLWQYWDMFSPVPIQYDGWIIIDGQFEDGTAYDLVTGSPATLETATRWYWGPQMRWEKFEENVYRWQYPALLNAWAGYYCRTLNENPENDNRLATLQIRMVYVNFYAPDGTPNDQQIDLLWSHWCYDEFAPQG